MVGAGTAVSLFALCSTDNRLYSTGQVRQPDCTLLTVGSVRQQMSEFCSLHDVAVDIFVT